LHCRNLVICVLGLVSIYIDEFSLFIFTDAWSQIPDTNFLVKNGPTICNKAIESISEVVSFGEVAKKFKELIEKIKEVSDSEEWKKFCNRLCEHLTSTISSKKIMLPSTLWNNIFESIESISSGLEIRNHLKQMLFAALRISDSNVYSNAVEIFICDIVLYTGEQMLSFIRESIIGTRQVNLPVVSFDVEDRQTIHYVGGSTMHGFKKKGKAYSGNQEWQQILVVIDTKIDSASPDVQPPSDADREWTDDVDRGGLLIIGAKCMEVFMGIAAVVSTEIKADGSVPHEKVLDRVYSSPVPVLWDNMVACEEMSESLSLRFMNGVVKNFSQTYGRGLMRKKLNEVHEKPYASINLRHTVAPKSK